MAGSRQIDWGQAKEVSWYWKKPVSGQVEYPVSGRLGRGAEVGKESRGDGLKTYLYTEMPAHIVPKVTRARKRSLGPQHLEAQGGYKTPSWVKLEVL